MKNLLLILPLVFTSSSCKTLASLASVPSAVVADVGGAVDVVVPGDDKIAETAGQVAATAATGITGNPLLGAAAGALVTGIAAIFLGKRKKKTA